MATDIIARQIDTLPSGTWTLGPVTVSWNLTGGNEVDVTVSVLGIQVDKLTGTLTANGPVIRNDVNVFGIVEGVLELEGKSDGLYIAGELKGPGFDLPFNHRIIAW